jgi:hypothetical protein
MRETSPGDNDDVIEIDIVGCWYTAGYTVASSARAGDTTHRLAIKATTVMVRLCMTSTVVEELLPSWALSPTTVESL